MGLSSEHLPLEPHDSLSVYNRRHFNKFLALGLAWPRNAVKNVITPSVTFLYCHTWYCKTKLKKYCTTVCKCCSSRKDECERNGIVPKFFFSSTHIDSLSEVYISSKCVAEEMELASSMLPHCSQLVHLLRETANHNYWYVTSKQHGTIRPSIR